jgi:uncharacterized protein with NAD-binding domain and iron-sulfur cluster
MAGMAAAWRLSEPGWQDRFASITVYQRGWRLGGKGASSRGVHGRIEEHGLHIWLGYYENAFRLLRECYAELDRPATDPAAPIRTWREAMVPAPVVGLEERHAGSWRHWVAAFAPNADLPGEPDAPGGVLPVAELVRRSLRRLQDFAASLTAPPPTTAPAPPGRVTLSTSPEPPPPSPSSRPAGPDRNPTPAALAAARIAVLATALEAATLAHSLLGRHEALKAVDAPLDAVRRALADAAEADDGLRRTWHLVSVITATVRGIVADGLLTDPRGFRKINGEDYRAWIGRHGAAPEALDSTLVRGLYDLVFAQEDADPERASFGAGWGVFLSNKTFFDDKGEIFWKMTAGMGDVVFAPLYEALRRRGVDFAFFHRVDGLHLSPDRTTIDAVSVGVQAHLAPGVERYEPLVRVRGLPCFPAAPLVDQLDQVDEHGGIEDQPLESHWCTWPDAERKVLRRGRDFDVAVLAIPLGMAPLICDELIADRREWRAMVANVRTVATQAFQLWLRADEPTLGWDRPGATMTGYVKPFDTWASMPQVLDAEDWPDHDRPGACAYFCTTLATPEPADDPDPQGHRAAVRANAVRFLEQDLPHLLPGVVGPDGGFRWDLLCGSGGSDGGARHGPDAFATQFWTANVDPSDRYVQSLAGTDHFRLRPDESGYDNLFLAGDWTDCGLNAGCIEAAVLSGLQAANAVLGRSRRHRLAGYYLF